MFNDTRWSARVTAAASALQCRVALQTAWDPKLFAIDKAEYAAVVFSLVDVASADPFWERCAAVVGVLQPVSHLRTWGAGCLCHEQDRKEGKPVQCQKAGRRMREAWPRVLRSLSSFASPIPLAGVELASLLRECHEARKALRGILHAKLSFLDRLPYKIARLRDPGVAAECLARFDEMSAAGICHHRVTLHFLAPDKPLRQLVQQAVDTGEFASVLMEALLPLEWGMLDEAAVEGEHRDLALEKQRAHGVRHGFAVSTVRQKQNSKCIDKIRKNVSQKRLFAQCWAKWKLMSCPPNVVAPHHNLRVPTNI